MYVCYLFQRSFTYKSKPGLPDRIKCSSPTFTILPHSMINLRNNPNPKAPFPYPCRKPPRFVTHLQDPRLLKTNARLTIFQASPLILLSTRFFLRIVYMIKQGMELTTRPQLLLLCTCLSNALSWPEVVIERKVNTLPK